MAGPGGEVLAETSSTCFTELMALPVGGVLVPLVQGHIGESSRVLSGCENRPVPPLASSVESGSVQHQLK